MGLGRRGKLPGHHGPDVRGVEILQLLDIEYGGGFRYAADVKYLRELMEGKNLALAAGGPAEQRDIVHNGVREVSVRDEVLVRGVAVALRHFVLRVPHDGRAVYIFRHVPAEAPIKKIVLRGAG